jgi:lipid II isoglutaminyl synthase (glutamine-hydrolysing)
VSGDPASGRGRGDPVTVVSLFPDLLGTYGDGGNAVVLAKRLAWRGYGVDLVEVHAGEPVPASAELYVIGGGEDAPQTEAARELAHQGALRRAVEGGAAVLAVCAGMQILGKRFPGDAGTSHDGLGLLDLETVAVDRPRAVGELLVRPDPSFDLPLLTGFENHGGRTRLGPGAMPLGRVEVGEGNGSGSEGAVHGKIVATYLHGPVLARNPALADLLLRWVVGDQLAPLDDGEATELRRDRIRAARQRELQPRRSWKDVIRRA